MSALSKRFGALGLAAFAAGLYVQPLTAAPLPSGDFVIAQAKDTKGKSDPATGQPGNQQPNGTVQSPSPTMQPSPQSGVPARCASIADATARQKCMNTPKGQ